MAKTAGGEQYERHGRSGVVHAHWRVAGLHAEGGHPRESWVLMVLSGVGWNVWEGWPGVQAMHVGCCGCRMLSEALREKKETWLARKQA